jgi:malate/lactate dehydrogenase
VVSDKNTKVVVSNTNTKVIASDRNTKIIASHGKTEVPAWFQTEILLLKRILAHTRNDVT